jgi:surfeit locus 1 family protein
LRLLGALSLMGRMHGKSLLGPTLFTLAGFLLLAALGTWQLERQSWKEGLISARLAAIDAAPIALPAAVDAARGLEFHQVRVAGRFLSGHELYLRATSPQGALGFQALAPLARADGGIVLVDRGFVPEDRKGIAVPDAGETNITGYLRLPPASKSWFAPDNRPATNEWFTIDLPMMERAAGLGPLLPFYIDMTATRENLMDIPNNHLQYAITWYALAAGLVAVYILLMRRHRLGEQK